MGPFRPASVPGGRIATTDRTGQHGPTDAAEGGPYMSWPPFTPQTCPVMNELWSEARK